MPENMRSASAEHFDALWSWNTLERRPWHCTLDFHTKVQVWGKSLSVLLQVPAIQRSIIVTRRCQPWLAWEKEWDKKREKKERERKEEGKSEREPWLNTLKQLIHTNNQKAAPLPYPSLCCSTQIGTSSHAQRETYLASPIIKHCANGSCLNKVRTHEARVSHTIAPTISRHQSSGKYTLINKGMVHQSFTHIYLHRTWSCKFLLPLYTFVCSGLDVFVRYIHRLFKLSIVLRLNSLL